MARLESSFKQGLLDYLRRHHADMCRHWFDEIEPLDIEGGVVRMLVREPVQLKYLQRCCVRQFTEAAQQVSGRLLALRFVGPEEEFVAAPPTPPVVDHDELPRFEEQMLLSPDYTFDNFVVGPGNRLAHAAAIAVADKPGRAYNPYFIHGGVGLGKTHLLQAITQTILRNNRSARICYISCGTFTDAFHDSVKAGRMNEFRHRFRNADVLVIDDIHFLSKREQSQEEFFHTFNALYQAGRQVVLSSDAAPQDIPDLEERLTSRFNCGLVARIDRPCFETRVSILRGKARMLGLDLPDDVPAYIAARIDTNIRELEGALTRVRGLAAAMDAPISLELAKAAIAADTPTDRPGGQPNIQAIVDAVTRFYDVKLTDLLSKRRHKSIALPRQVCMWLARRHTRFSLEEIGGYFGGRDHTTVMHAIRTIDARKRVDQRLSGDVERIESDLQGEHASSLSA
jgi:chromosomal replication initiator protein